MNFPGENLLTLTQEALHEIIRDHFAKVFSDKVRILAVETSGYYSSGGVKVAFTTDDKNERELRHGERSNATQPAPETPIDTQEAPL